MATCAVYDVGVKTTLHRVAASLVCPLLLLACGDDADKAAKPATGALVDAATTAQSDVGNSSLDVNAGSIDVDKDAVEATTSVDVYSPPPSPLLATGAFVDRSAALGVKLETDLGDKGKSTFVVTLNGLKLKIRPTIRHVL